MFSSLSFILHLLLKFLSGMKCSIISQPVPYVLLGFTYALDGYWRNNLILFYLSFCVLEKEAVTVNHFLNCEELNCVSSASQTPGIKTLLSLYPPILSGEKSKK